MRRLIGLAAALGAATGIAQTAQAADAPLSLRSLMAATAITPLADPLAQQLAGPSASASAIADFRLDALAEAQPSLAGLLAASETGRLRRGFGAAIMDYFPLGADGFHISGGARFYNRGLARMNPDSALAHLLYAPRSSLARASRRMTPALTLGYTRILQHGLSLGMEGGAVLGKFDSLAGALVRPPRLRGAGLEEGAGQLNQIARMTFGYHF